MSKRVIPLPFRFLLFLLLFSLIVGAFSALSSYLDTHAQTTLGNNNMTDFTVVLDAGHGGEDGGAVSASGIYEKNINLAVTMLVRDLLISNGISVVMTRETDILLYDPNSDYHGHKKEQDLATRLKIAESAENAIFVSIHMNAYPQAQYHGLQVWYSPHHAQSLLLAQEIQSTVRLHLQPENNRKIKPATDAIFLLHHLKCPAVLIECGFLSNPEEAAKLNTPVYQQQLAFLIFLSILNMQNR